MSGSPKTRPGNIAQGQGRVFASPHEGFLSLMIASARGKQLELEATEDPDLERLIGAHRHEPRTLEPSAACTGWAGELA